ncbi:hypothetical protein [Rubellimicrobium roseum]|uniref:Uncharacterized protein n=1 Tax=Rubellimicrobium roseum TaxID=687525 RepID=A0A5C4NN83_9RHOB|nr:hypothetical protein [Rubellimicrobium roseum]TNC73839.1 hypothetical protein FHG71_05040 [Rubellimicrobium roseum]
MSAPKTNIDKQTRRHRGPLQGMFAVVLFALVLLAILGFWAFGRGGDPQGAATQVQEGTGTTESGGANDAITANDSSEEEAGSGAATDPAADPTAVTVPSQTVTAPQTGQTGPVNPTTGDSTAAQPLDPVEEDGAATEGGAATDSATE